jgi:AcrR family transcriptional regulator
MEESSLVRRRNAADTRAAILRSARRAFARAGYDGAGVREIAREAGVTAMLVNRYFGSKERLFAEVVADTMAKPVILTEAILASPTIGVDFASALLDQTGPEATPLDGFLILFRSASNPATAAIGREQIEKMHHRTLTAALPGHLAAERSAILLSLVAGFQMMRQMIGLSALAKADRATLISLLAPMIQQIVEGNVDRPG